ncbi:hypothetical protein RIVM261_011730 [Rivularia sp. IAM M-261]|nr:hypothetical protein RIVM261_011730 [Rivularia sp. IAM M-261]
MSPLKRREFGQLAAATLTSTVIADFCSKALAQKTELSREILYEINLPSSSNVENRENQAPSVELITTDLAKGNVISRINQPELSVDNPLSAPKISRAFYIADSNRITKAIVLRDKTLLISTVSSTRSGYFNYLISAVASGTISKFTARKVLGLEKGNQTIESLLSLPNNQLLCLLGNEGIPPFTFRTLDITTGKILSGDELNLPPLPLRHRFANLCQDRKGNIFATEITSEGIPILISMNLEEKAQITGKVKIKRLTPLSFEGRSLSNDLKDLNFSPSGQLYAVAADNSEKNNIKEKNNALFTVDVKSGKMGLVRKFAAEKFAFSL